MFKSLYERQEIDSFIENSQPAQCGISLEWEVFVVWRPQGADISTTNKILRQALEANMLVLGTPQNQPIKVRRPQQRNTKTLHKL